MNNNIPQGYKQSPLGVIPQDWEVRRLGEIAHLTSGATPLRSNNLYFDGGIIPWIKTTDLNNSILNKSEECVTNKALDETSIKILPKETVLVAMYGGFNQIGRTALLGIDSTINQALCALLLNRSIALPKYVLYWLNAKVALWRNFAASSRKDPNITSKDVSHFPIVIPPLAEQERIAEVLGTWDVAIEKQGALVDALTRRKQALMQQLLTARKRLPNFTAPWQEVKLGDVAKRVTRKNSEQNTNVMTISAQKGFVSQTDFFNKSIASNVLDNYYLVQKGEFCYNKSYSNGYPMGAIKRLNNADKAVVTTLYICFEIESGVCVDFMEHLFESGILNEGLMKVANEGGRAHGLLNVTPSDFFALKITLPPTEEQKAISQILTTADREIELATTKLNTLRTQKRALMQQLLTGKKRLKVWQ
ncbi:MAG: restriction endonuclease subunit S [Rikenellaceae bacterium]